MSAAVWIVIAALPVAALMYLDRPTVEHLRSHRMTMLEQREAEADRRLAELDPGLALQLGIALPEPEPTPRLGAECMCSRCQGAR